MRTPKLMRSGSRETSSPSLKRSCSSRSVLLSARMPDLAWSGSVATRPISCRLESSPPPAHACRRDGLAHTTFDGQRLQVGQPFLQSESLFVEVVARTPQVQCHLPTRLLLAANDLCDLIEPPLMMRDEHVDTATHIGER